jgi:hypothetical protein
MSLNSKLKTEKLKNCNFQLSIFNYIRYLCCMLTTSPFIVTVGRCFGSGGRELGSLLAKRLNVEFYDKKLLLDAARQSGFLPELIERGDERQPSIFGGVSFSLDMFMSSPFTGPACVTDDTVYQAQSDVIRHLGRTREFDS